MKQSLNQKLYSLDDTKSNFYTKGNEIEISNRWDKKAKYWDKQLETDNIHLNQNEEYDNFIKISKKIALSFNHINNLLEIGCGTGLVSKVLSQYVKRGVGIDISSEMILEAKKKNIKNITFYKKSFFDLDKNIDGTFDLIVSRGILISHYGQKYLTEILDIFFTLANDKGCVIFDFLNKDVSIDNVHLPNNKEYYTKKTIKEYALKSGFQRVEIYGNSIDRTLIGLLYK